jgi:hypothetical protein
LAVAIGNCPNIKVQNKHVQIHKIMSRGPISFSEWVGVCTKPPNSQAVEHYFSRRSRDVSGVLLPQRLNSITIDPGSIGQFRKAR